MKPRILVARAVFPETLDKLRAHFDVEDNQADELWNKQQFAAKLAGKTGALTTSQPVDAETLAGAGQLKICANMAGIAAIGSTTCPWTMGAGMPSLSSGPVPNMTSAHMPHSMGSMPRPRKMRPVQVITFLAVAGLLVENMRMAVVCQQVLSETHKSACQTRNVQPKRGLVMGLNPAGPMTAATLSNSNF